MDSLTNNHYSNSLRGFVIKVTVSVAHREASSKVAVEASSAIEAFIYRNLSKNGVLQK